MGWSSLVSPGVRPLLASKECFKTIWNSGGDWLLSILNKSCPYLSVKNYPIENITIDRKRLEDAGKTLHHLDREEPEFLVHTLVLKTFRIPLTLQDYEKGVSILSTFKTIHLEYLKDITIENIEDIQRLLQDLWD